MYSDHLPQRHEDAKENMKLLCFSELGGDKTIK